MNTVVADFETYWSEDFTLSKMTTEAYVRDPRFEVILCGFRFDSGERIWIPGPKVGLFLQQLGLHQYAVVAHHAHFDGLILSHCYDVYPRMWLDTLSMSRAINGTKGGNGLAACAKRHGIGIKGEEVLQAKGMRFADFSPAALARYGVYCLNDCDLEWELLNLLLPHFQLSELRLIDKIVRCFTEPILQLDTKMLSQYAKLLASSKASILADAGIDLKTVMSNDKFAAALRFLGIEPPTKLSVKKTAKAGKPVYVYAFAKTDKVMQDLAENGEEAVQILIAARLQNKTTIAETRALRMIGMQGRGAACIYYKYCGAEDTMRMSGGDKMNWQNLTRGSILRHAVGAPPGWVNVVGDSSNIEARILDTLAGQENMIEAYRRYDAGVGPDIYCVTGESLFGRVITKEKDPDERQASKVVKLSSGYGISGARLCVVFRKETKKVLPLDTGNTYIKTYRRGHMEVVRFWAKCEQALFLILRKQHGVAIDRFGLVKTCEDGLLMPNGLRIRYLALQYHGKKDFNSPEKLSGFTYWDGKMRTGIHGSKMTGHICQCLARIIVMDQIVAVKRKLVITSHDEGAWCIPEDEAEDGAQEIRAALRVPPAWWPQLPVNASVGYHQSYGKVIK